MLLWLIPPERTKRGLFVSVIALAALFLAACGGGAELPPRPSPKLAATEAPSAGPEEVLGRFMRARIQREDQAVLALLTDSLRAAVMAGQARAPVLQVSNPCSYRWTLEGLERPTQQTAVARIRMYQHFWGGDVAGGLPRSWEQEVGLVTTAAGWRVDRLGPVQQERQEPNEPHGATTSACNVARQREG